MDKLTLLDAVSIVARFEQDGYKIRESEAVIADAARIVVGATNAEIGTAVTRLRLAATSAVRDAVRSGVGF